MKKIAFAILVIVFFSFPPYLSSGDNRFQDADSILVSPNSNFVGAIRDARDYITFTVYIMASERGGSLLIQQVNDDDGWVTLCTREITSTSMISVSTSLARKTGKQKGITPFVRIKYINSDKTTRVAIQSNLF